MAKDAYGNEVVDPFDLAIAQGVMRATWGSAVVAVVLMFASGCCGGALLLPFVGGPVAPATMLLSGLLGFLAMASAVNVVIRVMTMQPEHKSLVPSWHPWAALGLAAAAAGAAVLQVLGAGVVFMYYSMGA